MVYNFLLIPVLIVATITDIKSRIVPNRLSHGLIVVAITIRFICAIYYNDFRFLMEGILGSLAMFVIGWGFFELDVWGGGDAKLFLGTGALVGLPIVATGKLPLLLHILFNTFLAGFVWSAICKLRKTAEVPYVPAILIGTCYALGGFYFLDLFL